jgi:predicted dienelactone hydrolase
LLVVLAAGCGSSSNVASTTSAQPPGATTHNQSSSTASAPAPPPAKRPKPVRHTIVVREVMLHLTDPARTMTILGKVVPRSFDVVVRYPAGASGPLPLIVFGHGYAVTPAPYARLLNAWTRGGYVVAAPIFPLENANAPGGPNEQDLVNQPADMSLVITDLRNRVSPKAARLASLIDFGRIAVAGQSDGGDTALAAAYGPERDRRIKAAVILSGAEDPFAPRFGLPRGGPPLLATQGTADTINPPPQTYYFFGLASPPRYLLKLLGAGHLPPYTVPGPELSIVERMTLAFLDRYLKNEPAALNHLVHDRSAGPGSVLISQP